MGCSRPCREIVEEKESSRGEAKATNEKGVVFSLFFLFGVGEFEKRMEVVCLFFLLAFLF